MLEPGALPSGIASLVTAIETRQTTTTTPDDISPTPAPAEISLSLTAAPVVCGDGIRTRQEGCDDGNLVGGDGCSAGCVVEVGYGCENRNPYGYGGLDVCAKVLMLLPVLE